MRGTRLTFRGAVLRIALAVPTREVCKDSLTLLCLPHQREGLQKGSRGQFRVATKGFSEPLRVLAQGSSLRERPLINTPHKPSPQNPGRFQSFSPIITLTFWKEAGDSMENRHGNTPLPRGKCYFLALSPPLCPSLIPQVQTNTKTNC